MGGGDCDSGSQRISVGLRGCGNNIGIGDCIVYRLCDFDDTNATLPKPVLCWSGGSKTEESEEREKEWELHNEGLVVRMIKND